MDTTIEAHGLVKRFGDTTALGGVDLAARTGTVLAVLGQRGGQTTAVRILATLTQPDGGRALVGGNDVVAQAQQVRRLIARTGQYAAVDETLTGRHGEPVAGRGGLKRPGSSRRSRGPATSTTGSPGPARTSSGPRTPMRRSPGTPPCCR